ncbi:MAG: GGDEF domain-containing protein [Treponema sp.]|jgi:diguanylate cyclase (GGDEF)-like protein|nr:GGDEF domain-containing protein [Treponema sp.]
MREKKENLHTKRHIMLLLVIFCLVTLAVGIITYNFAAAELKKQLVNKCHALAATIAAVIAEDSDAYAEFLNDMTADSAYYNRIHNLMIKIRQKNDEHITYIYTQRYRDDNTFAFVFDGEPTDSPLYTPPGVQEQMTSVDLLAFREKRTVLGSDFIKTGWGDLLAALVPIFHTDTGEFLGLAGADTNREQYNSIMNIFIFQTAISIAGAFIVLALCMKWLSDNVHRFIKKERDFANLLLSANKKLEELSTKDELTTLNNRRSFSEYMNIVWKQNHRLNLPVTVLMIDVDCFKKYNDSLGHLEGDKALIAVAQCIKNHVKRETDFVARFGGEEFICLLPFIKSNDALDFANTLVANVEKINIPHPSSETSQYITISAGMATIVPDDNNSQTQLLHEADRALYEAKKSGRNRVVVN